MADMSTAPRDGTRILIKRHTLSFVEYGRPYARTGTSIVECWWRNDKWQEWCGRENSSSTDHIDPIEWYPHPDLEKGIQ